MIFPEGTRVHGNEVVEPKSGVIRMAVHLCFHQFHQLPSRIRGMLNGQLLHKFPAQLFTDGILGLAEAVGIKEQHVTCM